MGSPFEDGRILQLGTYCSTVRDGHGSSIRSSSINEGAAGPRRGTTTVYTEIVQTSSSSSLKKKKVKGVS